MAYMDHVYYLKKAIEVSKKSREHGNTPFGALLVTKDGNILMEQENLEITEKICTGHAEATLAARASQNVFKGFLGSVRCIPQRSPAPCVQVLFTGPILAALFME